MARLFVAVTPPAVVMDVIAALARPAVKGVRWTAPEQWHVTLRFFGEADVDEASVACARIDGASCEVSLGPAVERLGPGVAMAPVHGLGTLNQAVRAATESVGSPPDDRPYRGHITLARIKGRARCPLVGALVSARWTVGSIDLIRSDLGAAGARYSTLATYALS